MWQRTAGVAILLMLSLAVATAQNVQKVTFPSRDGLQITADVLKAASATAPWLVLCHQARWSRGEYRETMPWFADLGYNCIAVDLRSGGEVNGVVNETHQRAVEKGLGTTYVDAQQDMEAAIEYVRKQFKARQVILVGSSYSAALALVVAALHPEQVDGVIAFSPGEYFVRLGKSENFIAQHLAAVQCPVLITCAAQERHFCEHFQQAVRSGQKVRFFVPPNDGAHGSRALWKQFPQSQKYRTVVREFLEHFFPVGSTK